MSSGALQIFVSSSKDILELLKQLNQLNIDNKFQINIDFHLLQVFFIPRLILSIIHFW
jgi:hypothetical protein